ncbi:MAG: sensor histidine kinase, partial [Flavisolibacter sp.]
ERMSDSLKALLNFTKLHREEKPIPVDLNEIVAPILVDLELMITQKKAIIQVGDLPVINAIPIQMQQLFYNLIHNALKFSNKDRTPEINLTCRQIGEEKLKDFPQLNPYKQYCKILVTDNGIGFDQKHSKQIFTIFQRLHSKSEYDGSGIGLSLVKKVVSNHKGEIYVVSQPEKGTSFHVILPVS